MESTYGSAETENGAARKPPRPRQPRAVSLRTRAEEEGCGAHHTVPGGGLWVILIFHTQLSLLPECLWIGLSLWDTRYTRNLCPIGMVKGSIPIVGHRVWDGQARQRSAIFKGTMPYVRDRIWDGQVHQRAAMCKGIIANERN